jgi:hypothetical protein
MTDIQDTPNPSDKPQLLDDLIASIRAAVARDASADARAIGATACRSILTALDAQPGQPLTAAPSAASASHLAGMLHAFATMPREQLLDLLISKLRAALPPGTPTAVTGAPRFHLIQIPQVQRPGGGS